MPVLKKCCCCCDLETGTVILGWLGLATTIAGFVGGIIGYISVYNSMYRDPVVEGFISAHIISSLLGVIVHGCLIYGTVEKKHLLLLPWLVVNAIPSFGSALLVFVGGIAMFCTEIWRYGFLLYFVGFPITGLYIYLWLCMHSTYTKLKDDKLQSGSSLTYSLMNENL